MLQGVPKSCENLILDKTNEAPDPVVSGKIVLLIEDVVNPGITRLILEGLGLEGNFKARLTQPLPWARDTPTGQAAQGLLQTGLEYLQEWNISRNGTSTTSWDNPFQCFTKLIDKNLNPKIALPRHPPVPIEHGKSWNEHPRWKT